MKLPVLHTLLPLVAVAACASPAARTTTESELVAFCERFLDDYSNARWDCLDAMLAPHAISVHFDPGHPGGTAMTASDFLARMKPIHARLTGFRETIVGTPSVVVDGAIASVWAEFKVMADQGGGTGIDVFHLVKLADGWKLAALCDRFVPDPK